MAFENIIDANPKTHTNSETGLVTQKLNQIFQVENGDLKIVIDLSNPETYLRYNKTNSHFEVYVNGSLQGHIP